MESRAVRFAHKKLTDAVARLAGGGSKHDIDDLDYWDAPEEYRPKEDDDVFEIYPENWDVFQLYIRLQTQWYISPMGGLTGLNYSSIQPVARFMGIKITPEVFADLQLMELTQINLSHAK